MEEENKKGPNVGIKLIGLVFALLAIPFKFFLSNPKALMVLFVVLGSIGGTIYLARTNPKLLGIKTEMVSQENEDLGKLVNEVGEIIALPQGETPTLATVSDVEKVKDQNFFKNAQNGDKVLIFSQAKKAYLYRPSEKKIIEVGVVNLGSTDGMKGESDGETKSLKLTPTVILSPTASPVNFSPTSNPD